ncbi:MAG: LCP family protein [Candidatus Promineofilum sp.]|nr:LCP family protein [Promineifilum sp.]MCW5865488.1 LCP family protein [Anaerolineae bacterium]
MYRQPLLPGWLSALLSAAFVFSAVAVLFFAYLTVQHLMSRPAETVDAAGAEGGLSPAGGELPPAQVIDGSVAATPTPAAPTIEAWDGDSRVNILLMGIDRRPGEGFVSRTDTMMILSIDPQTDSAVILSIPRDLYVDIPGFSQDRINTALVLGARNGDYLDGAALAMQTVSYNLNIPVHHFVLVDFNAFVRSIDLLGGIDVDVPYEINDPEYPDMNYGYDPLYIPAGLQHFDGVMALKYARTRHGDTDFNRAYRQQQVLFAARQQALNLGIGEMLLRAPSLYREVEEGIRTDLSLEQMLRLAKTVSDMPSGNIRNEVLDYDYVSSYRTPGGASVLLLRPETAVPLIESLFGQ